MPLTGDDAKLAQLGGKLKAVERDAIGEAIAEPMKEAASDLYQKSFSKQHGPIGGPWPASPNSMFASGDLANPSVDIGAKMRLAVKAVPHYAIFHQGGWDVGGERVSFHQKGRDESGRFQRKTKTVRVGGKQAGPARPVLPSRSTAGEWEEPLQNVIDKGVREHFKI